MSEDLLSVEVSYALPKKQQIIALQVKPGTSVFEAVKQSGIDRQFEGLVIEEAKLGVFGKVVANPHKELVNEGDRVEVYRPLIADPKEVRKARAAKGKAKS